MDKTLRELLATGWRKVTTVVRIAWTAFWLLLVATSPLYWTYLCKYGPREVVEITHVRLPHSVGSSGEQRYEDTAIPAIFTAVMLDVLFLFAAFAPHNNWYQTRR
jgi:hypothetical protein